jgi:hypothetical protein
MNTAQTLLAAYQNPQHESHNDLLALLKTSLAESISADQHFDGNTIQYTFKDGSDLMISTHKNVEHSSLNYVNLTLGIRASD